MPLGMIQEHLDTAIDKIPELLRQLEEISPWLMIAVVVGALIRWAFVPLIRAWKDED